MKGKDPDQSTKQQNLIKGQQRIFMVYNESVSRLSSALHRKSKDKVKVKILKKKGKSRNFNHEK